MLICRTLMLAFAWLALSAHAADTPPAANHLGVASCAGSTCHGAVKPIGKHPIRQDEYFIWQRKDSHAGAYNLLLEPRSNQISRHLGWGDAAQAQGCLTCHADTVEPASRGEKWLISDGVNCEVCHGGSGPWIESHVDGYQSLAASREAGLYPTWEPVARAQMCLSCHQGSRERPMTHAIMAAGHPPLLFELDTFSTLEPYHHDIDADYVERKGVQDPARNWAVGQAVAAERLLGALAAGRHVNGLMPELAFFDCDACHHSMKAGRWHAERTGGGEPGLVPLADSAIVLLGAWVRTVDPALAERWQAGWSRLYKSGYAGDAALRQEAASLRGLLLSSVLPRAQSASLESGQIRRVMGGVLAAASGAHAGDYYFAEQTAMATLVMGSALAERGSGGLDASEKAAVDGLYESVKDRDRFAPAAYREALQQLKKALGV